MKAKPLYRDSRDRLGHVTGLLTEAIESARGGANATEGPKAQALYETAAEVLLGLKNAFDHYATQAEPAMTEQSEAQS